MPSRRRTYPVIPNAMRTDLIPHLRRGLALTGLMALCTLGLPGCIIGTVIGGAVENYKRDSTHAVEGEYAGLTGKTFAVIVTGDRSIEADHPGLLATLTDRITERLRANAGASGCILARPLLEYLYDNPRWASRPPGDLLKDLGVDRLIMVELQEYRLNDPGNQYLWDGAAAASVSVLEAESALPDEYAYNNLVQVKFPNKQGIGPNEVSKDVVKSALVGRLVDRATWLFYTHQEPYYPEY